MTPKWIVFSGSMMVIALVVAGVSLLPPLTEGRLPPTVPPYGAASAPADTGRYCRANLTDVNCACFAQKAGEVLTAPHHPVQGMAYADRWDLARIQAGGSC